MDATAQPQSPWILYFDGATRDTRGNPAGIGAVLKNSRGHTMVELKKLINPGMSSAAAKYKALIAGLKKALSLGVEYMLVKGDSRLVHSQVVGHCSVQDDRLVDYQRKVMTLSKDFRALFLERISKEDNMRADQLANDAIDEELEVVDTLSEFIDKEWTSNEKHCSQQHSIHTHRHPHHHSHPLSHPLPPPPPHLKVKPVALVSPHVVKRHVGHEVVMKGEDDSPTKRSPLFCSDEESSLKVEKPLNARKHVQAAAKSRRRPNLFSTSPVKSPERCASPLLPHLDCLEDNNRDVSPFSTNAVSQQEGANSSGSTGTGEQDGYLPFGVETISSPSEESLSGDELSKADYERLVKTLLKGFFQRKKRN